MFSLFFVNFKAIKPPLMRLRFLFFVFGFLFFAMPADLIAQEYVWAQSAGSARSDKCIALRTDSYGYIYAAGYFGDSLTLGTNQLGLANVANASSKEVWLAKYDSTGYCHWAIAGGEHFDDRILGIATDDVGNTVITGTYWQTSQGITIGGLQIGAGPGNGGADQGFVAKVDPNGNMLWGHLIRSNSGDDQGMDAAFDDQGNIFVCGFMQGNSLIANGQTLDTDNTTGSKEAPYWLIKMDANGNMLWGNIFGNLPYDSAYGKYIERDIAMCVDENGDAYVTGGFDHTRVFETTNLTSGGHYDGFVIKYKSNGTFAWAKNFGSRKKDWTNGICSDKQGHVYVTGEHRDSLYYDGQFVAKNYNGRDVFVIKIDGSNGSAQWAKRAGSQVGGERGNDITADEHCNVYVCGDIRGDAKFGDNIILPPGGKQTFVARISPKGKWKGVAIGGGPDDNDRANAIAIGVNGQIYSGGFLRTNGQFGSTTLPYNGKADIWIARVKDDEFNKAYGFDLKKPQNREFCLGGSTTMEIPKNNAMDYTPKDGATLNAAGDELTFSPSKTTTYKVWASVGNVCTDEDTVEFTITVHPFPKAEFTISPSIVNLDNPNVSLTNNSSGAINYEWYNEGSLLGNGVSHVHTATEVGEICFELKAISDFGCRDSISHCATVVRKELFYFPNAFSPNGDTKNDIFLPMFKNILATDIEDYRLTIFNRWGQAVFQSYDVLSGWNGTYQGQDASMGSYYYSCQYKSPNEGVIFLRGDLTLVR